MRSLRPRRARAWVAAILVASRAASADPAGASPPAREASPPAHEASPVVDPDPIFRPIVTQALAREAVVVALGVAGHPEVRRALSSMATRVRTAAALPVLSLRGSHSTDDALRLAPTAGDPYAYTQSGGIGWSFGARLIWHFDQLVFNRDEVTVERLRAEREGDAAKLASRVLETLFAWQRASLRAVDPKATTEDQRAAAISRAEDEVRLDVMTGGWFSSRALANTSNPSP